MFKKVQVPFLKGTVIQTSAMQRDSGAWHGGNDYSAPIGTPILSGTSGTVIWSGNNPGGHGYAVVVKDANGNSILYSHMGTQGNPPAELPKVGTEVKAGDVIGTVGNTGTVDIKNGGGVLHVTVFDSNLTKRIAEAGEKLTNPQTDSASLGASSKPIGENAEKIRQSILDPDAYMQSDPTLFTPEAATPLPDPNYSHEGRVSPEPQSPGASSDGSNNQGTATKDPVKGAESEPPYTDPMGTDDARSIVSPVSNASTADQTFEEALFQAFQSPAQTYGAGVQVADASGGLPESLTPTDTVSNAPNAHGGPTFSEFLDTEANSSTPFTPQQQTALAAQLDKLGLGGEAELSFHSLPGGGALIANADGDIVGEIVQSSSGALNLKASGIDAQGNSVEVNQHISASGQSLTDAQYNAATQQQAGAMFNSLMAAGQWDHLSDLGKLSALVNLYNATDKLGEAFGASGDNLPGDWGNNVLIRKAA